MLRAARTIAVLATMTVAVCCQTLEEPFPAQATLNFDITDSLTATQLFPLPSPQIVSWRIEEASASGITGYPETFSFLRSEPCWYQLNALAAQSFSSACRTSGLTLQPGNDLRTANFRVRISRLELHVGARPDLTSAADPDGDGFPNSSDNCPIVYNPDQANSNATAEGTLVGDACSALDANDQPTIADQDLDGAGDSVDNCFWYPSPLLPGATTPADSDQNGIGDACERIAPVALPSGGVTIECDNVTFTPTGSAIAYFRMDFGRPGVLTCDKGFTGCTLDPSALRLSQSGQSTTFDCHLAP